MPDERGETTVRVPVDVLEAVRKIAIEHDRPLSNEVRHVLREYVAAHGGKS